MIESEDSLLFSDRAEALFRDDQRKLLTDSEMPKIWRKE